jgi:RNA polymerase sigma factor (sigma-70 family)
MGSGLRRTLEPTDVLQETLLTATTRFAVFRGTDESELRTWLSTLARRKLIDLARHNGRLKRALKVQRSLDEPIRDRGGQSLAEALAADPCTASRIAVESEMTGKLAAALEQIDRREAEVLWMRYVEGMTLPDIGRKIGTGRHGVSGIVARGLHNLRRLLYPT